MLRVAQHDIHIIVRTATFFDLHRSDRMLHDQYGMIRRTECLFLRFRQRVEGIGNQRDRKAAALLNLN